MLGTPPLVYGEERYHRRGPECGLDSRDFQEAADDRWLEEDEAVRPGRLSK